MAFKRSTVRSRPSPPTQRSDFRFSVFILRSFFKRDRTDSPSRTVRLGGARGTYNRGFAKQMRGACPSIPSVSTNTEKRFSFLCVLFCVSFFKGIEPTVHLARFASAEREGHIIGDLRSKCEGLAPRSRQFLSNPQTAVNKGLRSFL